MRGAERRETFFLGEKKHWKISSHMRDLLACLSSIFSLLTQKFHWFIFSHKFFVSNIWDPTFRWSFLWRETERNITEWTDTTEHHTKLMER